MKNRIGSKPIKKEKSVNLDYNNNLLKVKGANGELDLELPEQFKLDISEDFINVTLAPQVELTKKTKAIQGTLRQLINNMVQGVTEGFTKNLILKGVGYRAQINAQKLILNLGYSLPVEYNLPEKIKAKVEDNTKISLFSCDKQIIGQTAAEIRSYRPPEPYKGKGIHYENEQIIRKAGKTGKKAK